MIYDFLYLFLLFIIYSIIGYFVEVFYIYLASKLLNFNRGFLIGPYLPIYGASVICMIVYLKPYKDDLIVLFILSTVVCTIIEYVASYVLEKIFKLRWWDYSHLSFNINGRVCLKNSVLFGIGSIVVTKVINPLLERGLTRIPHWLIITISSIILVIFITDIIISFIAVFNIKTEVNKYAKKDATEAIKKEVEKFLQEHSFLRKQIERIFSSFPNVKSLHHHHLPDYKKLVEKFKKRHKKKTN